MALGRGMTYEKQGQNKIIREMQDTINRRLGIQPDIIPTITPEQAYNESVRVPGFMVANSS